MGNTLNVLYKKLMSSFYVDNCLASVQTQSELDRFIDVATEIMAERKFDLRGWEHSIPSDPIASPTNVLGMIWDRHCDNLSLNIPDLRELMEELEMVEGPSWLHLSPQEWPISDVEADVNEVEVNKERRANVTSMMNVQTTDIKSDHFSTYSRNNRVVAWILRFIHNVSNATKLKGSLSYKEFKRAEVLVFKSLQSNAFQDERLLAKMQAFKDEDGLLRIRIKSGDVVLIGHGNVRRIDWPLGVVLEVYPGKDGVPRVARIGTSHGERIHPFLRLYPLEVSAKTEIGVLKASGKDSLPVEKTHESSTNHVSDSPTDYIPDSPVESTDNSEEKPPTKTRLGRTIKIPHKLDL
ncbi:integrase_H2C2 domain-containing protein [Trichonephila clavata]|uniref:Integrase_H2C2 domain-containing protein n=1 Tax=Trichonephila clavata TaxID=2740835 RepID=A0A8X6L0Y9_TRICU|nr:integrase_H2C2 domain-containing protein [Trichonephila clavata]